MKNKLKEARDVDNDVLDRYLGSLRDAYEKGDKKAIVDELSSIIILASGYAREMTDDEEEWSSDDTSEEESDEESAL